MTKLSEVADLITDKVDVRQIDMLSYVTTENMVTDRGGVCTAKNTPRVGAVTKYKSGDVLVSNIRPYFKKIWLANKCGGASNDVLVFRAKEAVVCSKYLYYALADDKFFNYVMASAKGAKMPRGDKSQILKYEIDLPDLDTQKKIADTLNAFDDKIELNRQMNETLEEMGRALFRHYFIDNSEAKNWPKRRLGEFFDVVTGKKDANYATSDGKYPFFTCAQTISRAPTYSFDGDAILLAGNGDFNVKIYSGKFEAYQRTYVLIPYKSKLIGFLYYLMNVQLQDITGGSQGSVIRFITKGMIDGYSFALPDDDRLLALSGVFNNIVELSEYNNNENFVLVNIRDSIARKLVGR